MATKTKVWLSLLAVGIGIPTILLFTTLVNDVLFKEVTFCMSTFSDLAIKSLGILSAGVVTGFMTSLFVVRSNYWPHIVLSLFVLIKMFFFTGCAFDGTPFWYDTLLNLVLVSGLWLGNYGANKFPLAPV